MKIYINEVLNDIDEKSTAWEIRRKVKLDADLVILNGFPLSEDVILKENDRLSLIKKGEIPKREELEALLIARHTPGVHEKIKNAVVGIAGLGGLGSNIAISLARVGIGKLILVDYDVVEPSNLNRQQYFIKHIGMLKTEALTELISLINPFVKIEIKNLYVTEDNIDSCFNEAEIIVEAFDNPKCKALLVNSILNEHTDKYVVAASGMAGYFSNNSIKTRKITKKFYLIGDENSEAKEGCGLMAPRVAIAANHQANTVLRILLGEKEI